MWVQFCSIHAGSLYVEVGVIPLNESRIYKNHVPVAWIWSFLNDLKDFFLRYINFLELFPNLHFPNLNQFIHRVNIAWRPQIQHFIQCPRIVHSTNCEGSNITDLHKHSFSISISKYPDFIPGRIFKPWLHK
eukprot:TRINITY_DN4605_c1_g1_i10.p1 TRINITY_DN4605_c1_g1~~TRINITY_DN4605_c1_g1_i10.p1  ORF type:complete len:132 (+),score=4.30 TRINITY_DN4605_c1_g1_i10:1871-2266(+)